MRIVLAIALLAGCAARPHAEVFAKRNFGFAGPREITVVGPGDDVNALRLQLQKHGFQVLEVSRSDDSTTRYTAEIAGVCAFGLRVAPDTELHVFVLKTDGRERVVSVRLENKDDCPDAFFTEAAAAITRYWPEGQ